MTDWGIDPGGWAGAWPESDRLVIKFGRGSDPVPAETREDNPALDRLARELEPKVLIELHWKCEGEPLDLQELRWPQRFYDAEWPPGWAPPQRRFQLVPDHVSAGSVYWQAGAWWWKPDWGGVDDPDPRDLALDQPPAAELEVEEEQQAIEHAAKRVAWCAAVRHHEEWERWKSEH